MLGQACAHCRKFLAAAPRRSLGRVSVPVCRVVLSDPEPITGLVRHYHTNYLMGRGPSLARLAAFLRQKRIVCGISAPFGSLSPTPGLVSHVLLSRAPLGPKTPCDLHALGTPPAFVLSQDQTRRRMTPTRTWCVGFPGTMPTGMALLVVRSQRPTTHHLRCQTQHPSVGKVQVGIKNPRGAVAATNADENPSVEM